MDTLLTNTTLLYAIGAGLLAALATLVVGLGLRHLNVERGVLQERLRGGVDEDLLGLANDAFEQNLTSAQLAERLNTMINNRSFARRVAHELEQANLPIKVSEYLVLRVALPVVLMAIALVVWRTPLVAPPAIIVGAVLPELWIAGRKKRRRRDFNDQLAETLTMLHGALRGGFSLVQSLKMVSREAPQPTSAEFERTSQEIQLGLSLSDAMDNLARRMQSDDLDLVVTAIKINARVGGNLAEILQSISSTIRERGKLRREVRVITSMQRASAYVVGLLPVGLALIIFSINPEYMQRLFEPGWTLIIPIMAGILALAGFITIQKIADIKV